MQSLKSTSAFTATRSSSQNTNDSSTISTYMNNSNSSNKNSNHTNNNNSSTDSSTSSSSRMTTKWIEQFCSFDTNKFLCKVDTDYIMDSFNLIGLEEKVLHYRKALGIILDKIKESYFDSPTTSEDYSSDDAHEIEILSSAEILYGLIHARFILTDSGLQKMLDKYQKRRFGCCIRYYCDRAAMLPVGLSDQPGVDSVRLYCPRCMDIYVPHFSSKCVSLDGAYFGTGFPHMFFMVYPTYRPSPPTQSFVATLYGFKIHEQAYEYQRQQFEAAEQARKPVFRTTMPAITTDSNVQNIPSPLQQQQGTSSILMMNGTISDNNTNNEPMV